jgi:hypothetical protein
VDQSLQAVFYLDERPEINDVRDCAMDDLADLVPLFDGLPGIGLQALDAQSYALSFGFHVQHVDVDYLSWLKNVARVAYPSPRKLRDVNQPLESSQVYKSAEGTEVCDAALARVARVQLLERIPSLRVVQVGRSLREDEAAILRIYLNDLEGQSGADEMLQFLLTSLLVRRRCQF